MLEQLFDFLVTFWSQLIASAQSLLDHIATHFFVLREEIANFNPTQRVVLWIQFGVGLLTIIWIVFQFAWLRRLNEARLERHLEGVISAERDELADERVAVIAELDRVVKRRGLRRHLLLAWAHLRLTLSLITRLLSLGTTRGLADHNVLLLQVGEEHRARAIYTEIARDAIKKANLYRDAIENKTLEAQNALIFAGRVALAEKRSAAAIALFKKAKNLREDPDARVLIGNQLLLGGDLDGALTEYDTALESSEIKDFPTARSDAFRGRAKIYMLQGALVKARRELDAAKAIDESVRNYVGLARTHEMIGDIWRPRADRRRAAMRAYAKAIRGYQQVGLFSNAKEAREKSASLTSRKEYQLDGWTTKALERCANWILRQVERQRARAQTKPM